jgi:hypothetical protein
LTLFLSHNEIAQLTGYVRSADQIKWLSRKAWVHEVAANGHPVVLRSYAEARLGQVVEAKGMEPDFSFLEKAA